MQFLALMKTLVYADVLSSTQNIKKNMIHVPVGQTREI